jgi:hypothetical protein
MQDLGGDSHADTRYLDGFSQEFSDDLALGVERQDVCIFRYLTQEWITTIGQTSVDCPQLRGWIEGLPWIDPVDVGIHRPGDEDIEGLDPIRVRAEDSVVVVVLLATESKKPAQRIVDDEAALQSQRW